VAITNPSQETFTATGAGAIKRSVASRLGDVVSVKDFGAVGDGVGRRAQPPWWRTAVTLLMIALCGGVVCFFTEGDFADYASLLKVLAFAAAGKSGWEHHVNAKARASGPTPTEPPK